MIKFCRVKFKVTQNSPRRSRCGVEVQLYSFFNPDDRWDWWSKPFYPQERAGTHCTEGWVGLRNGLDRCGNLAPTGIRSPDRPASTESLYRLSYLCSKFCTVAPIVHGLPLWNYHRPGAKNNEVTCRIWVLCVPDTGCMLGQSAHKVSEVRPSPTGSSLQRCSLITLLSLISSPRPVRK